MLLPDGRERRSGSLVSRPVRTTWLMLLVDMACSYSLGVGLWRTTCPPGTRGKLSTGYSDGASQTGHRPGSSPISYRVQNCHIRVWFVAFAAVASYVCLPIRVLCVTRSILC